MKYQRRSRKRKTIVLDGDGVVFAYDGWKGPDHVGAVDPEAVSVTRFLDYLGYDVVVSTARQDVLPMAEKLRTSSLVAKEVTNRKPIGVAYIDDRGVHHTQGNWPRTMAALAELLNDPDILMWESGDR